MKIKVGDKWYESGDTSFCVVFSKEELELVKSIRADSEKRRFISGQFASPDDAFAWADEGFKSEA